MNKIFLTTLLAIMIPTYMVHYGPTNFLWFSDISLFLIYLGVCTSSSLYISMAATLTLFLELNWTLDFIYNSITGVNLLGLADYMFSNQYSLFLRGLSLFHLLLPIYSFYYLFKWGYDKKSFIYTLVLYWTLIIICYFFTPIEKNINWVHYPLVYNWPDISNAAWLLALLTMYPLLIMWPKSIIFSKLFSRKQSLRCHQDKL